MHTSCIHSNLVPPGFSSHTYTMSCMNYLRSRLVLYLLWLRHPAVHVNNVYASWLVQLLVQLTPTLDNPLTIRRKHTTHTHE